MGDTEPTSGQSTPEPVASSAPGKFPPYPPYDATPAPPSVAETIIAGRDLRVTHKSGVRPAARPLPKPARPKAPKVTDIKLSRRAMRAHARCLRRHGAVLTDRLERLAKPRRRNIIYLWREHADLLPPETIERFRCMLNADEPFKPDQAYEYFINCRKTKKKANAVRCTNIKRDMQTVVTDKRFVWARNATVAFARGIQQRLARPGHYALADGMLRLSNVILAELCGYMKMRMPSRRSTNSKAKFMMEMSDKVAVWIDEILSESDDRMLMMDFDEDEDILHPGRWGAGGGGDDFADDFLNMMGGSRLLKGPSPAYLKFQGEMLVAFTILTDAMTNKGAEPLISYGKFKQTYSEGADELKQAPDFTATDFNTQISGQLSKDLAATAAPTTPPNIAPFMAEMVEICANYLAQNAEFNKDKGPAFKLLVQEMKKKPREQLYQKDRIKCTYGQGATKLEKAKGLETDHDDPNLSQSIHAKLSALVNSKTPPELQGDMAETLDLASKYLSQNAVDEVERGPAFDILIKRLESQAARDFTPQFPPLKSYFHAAYVLKSAPGFSGITPDAATVPVFTTALHKAVDDVCPKNLISDMKDKALQIIIKAMKRSPTKELAKRGPYTMNYGVGALETETAPAVVAYAPVKDIADEMKGKIGKDSEADTPSNLKIAVKGAVGDVSKHLSQGVAARSGAAGPRYKLNLLSAVMASEGDKSLFTEKSYTETYGQGAEVLKYAGKLESDPKAEHLRAAIDAELDRDVPTKLAPTLVTTLGDTMKDASKHLAMAGMLKAEALEHLIKVMKEEGDKPLGVLQGYEQTYNDGARRIINADSLVNDKVDKGAYENVHGKLKALVEKKPPPNATTAKVMPAVVDEVAQFLASPFPETEAEKRKVLAELMARKGDEILAQEGSFKMTYTEGGKEIMNAPVGVTKSHDDSKKKKMEEKINGVIPDKKLKDTLHAPVEEGSAHLTDHINGVGQALGFIESSLKKEGGREFLHVGKFDKTYAGAGEMLHNAKSFGGEHPNATIKDVVDGRLDGLDKSGASDIAKKNMPAAMDVASNHISDVATKECGLDAQGINAWKAAGGDKGGAGGRPGVESEAERLARLKAGQDAAGGGAESEAARLARLKAEQEAGARPGEDEAARLARLKAEQDAAAHAGESESARLARLKAEQDAAASAGGAGGSGGVGGDEAARLARLKAEQEAAARGAESEAARLARLKAEQDAAARSGGVGGDEAARLARLKDAASGSSLTAEEQARLARLRAERDAARRRKKSGGDTDADEAERQEALAILHRQLQAKGNETFYKQPHSELSHKSASEWLKNPSMTVHPSIKDSGDTTRLANKFERKLDALVNKVTPANLMDSMLDVVIESARSLAEYFVAENYKALVKDALISEMQKHGDDILIEKNGLTETNFFAAQRLKNVAGKVPPASDVEPSRTISHLYKRLEDTIRCRSMPRKLIGTMKEHIRNTAYYLADIVTTPDAKIEAYVALLKQMDAHGNELLVQGEIPKSYEDSASYLKLLTSCEDQINLRNGSLEGTTANNMHNIMKNVPLSGYSKGDLDGVIRAQSKLLVSYIMLQVQRTALLKLVVKRMAESPEKLLLRHGSIRKSNSDGAQILSGKNTDQLTVTAVDPVVERKVQIKMVALMEGAVKDNQKDLMDGVISDATRYLAVHLLKPLVIQVCKCMKSVFVQCELWCEEIMRRMSRPCCSCSRQLSVAALADLAPGERLVTAPGVARAHAPSVDITVKPCSRTSTRGALSGSDCPAPDPTEGCRSFAASYMLYSTEYNRPQYVEGPTRLPAPRDYVSTARTSSTISYSSLDEGHASSPLSSVPGPRTSPIIQHTSSYSIASSSRNRQSLVTAETSPSMSYYTPASFIQSELSKRNRSPCHRASPTTCYMGTGPKFAVPHLEREIETEESSQSQCYERHGPAISTDQMPDWHAMMVSLTWNVQAWRKWIQDTIDRALLYHHSRHNILTDAPGESWNAFRRKVATEALQWRQYNIFSRHLILRLLLRYKDRKIVSPTRATVKNKDYMKCQNQMMEIINMFNRWTHWLCVIVRESDAVRPSSSTATLPHDLRWNYFKNKVEEYAEDWRIYNNHLKVFWDNQFMALIPEWLSAWNQDGPVWVVSACGAVPSGAVSAGVVDGETAWVARSTHRCRVLPAALRPSQHCCVLYADGKPQHYTKYQVLCNAAVEWVPWHAGTILSRAVLVSARVHAGRVLYRGSHLLGAVLAPAYRCHVVIHNRPFAFNTYELLVLAEEEA